MSPSNTDPNFENFRRQRKRAQVRYSGAPSAGAGLRDIQEYESRQMHEQQLTREVHEFLSAATRQAASIVEKVTVAAESEAAQRLNSEMHEFLAETVRRVTTFLMQVQTGRGRPSLAELEPHISNLVGPTLDGFRFEGTAQLEDKHIGQDPFADPVPAPGDSDEPSDAGTVDAETPKPHAAPAAGVPPTGGILGKICSDPETLKRSLKALVAAGVLDPEAARRIYCDAAERA